MLKDLLSNAEIAKIVKALNESLDIIYWKYGVSREQVFNLLKNPIKGSNNNSMGYEQEAQGQVGGVTTAPVEQVEENEAEEGISEDESDEDVEE